MRLAVLALLLALAASHRPAAAAQALHVFIWSEYLDPSVIRDFERQHDARLVIDLFDESEVMLAKMQNGGAALYDIVVPPDYLVPVMARLSLLAPLRHDRLPNLRHLAPRFRSPPYDPTNTFSVAYQWGTLGLFFRRIPGQPDPDSWAAIFDPARQHGPLVLIDSMRDAIGAGLKFLGHSFNATDTDALKKVRDLLLDAKKRSVAFEGSVGGKNRVLSKSASIAMVYSGEAARGMREDPHTSYVVPKEGSEIWVDNLCIPSAAPHRDLAESFINFLLDPAVSARNCNYTQFAAPSDAARALVRPADRQHPAIYPSTEVEQRLEFAAELGPRSRTYDQIWTQVKTR